MKKSLIILSIFFISAFCYVNPVFGQNISNNNTQSLKTLTCNPPPVTVTSDHTLICLGEVIMLTAGGANTYSWNAGATGISITISPTVSTTYTVTGTDLNGCTNTAAILIGVLNSTAPTIIASSSRPATCVGEATTLTAQGAITYTWKPGSLGGSTVVVSPTISTTYMVSGTGTNSCQNMKKVNQTVSPCTSITQIVSDAKQFLLYPNPGNGTFFIQNENGDAADLIIYNLDGQKILYTNINAKTTGFDISLEPNGMYVVEIKQQGLILRSKLIKN